MEIINAVPKVIKDETVRINKYTILERKKCKLFYIHLFRHPTIKEEAKMYKALDCSYISYIL
jgi:hypothetical protein